MANRDPQYYPQPDEVTFDREAKPHLAFGLGPHRCVGLHLARLELKIAFTELRRRMPKFELVSGVEPHENLGLAWGVENVHLTFPAGTRETEDPDDDSLAGSRNRTIAVVGASVGGRRTVDAVAGGSQNWRAYGS